MIYFLPTVNEDVLNTVAFMLLPFLMNTSTIRLPRAKKQWRPSKIEILQGFITHVRSSAEVEDCITRRKNKLAEFGLQLQPFIIIVGPSLKEITARYIVINDVKYSSTKYVRYQSTSITHAVDSCFKILFILNAEYSRESSNVWYFIQKGFYQLTTKYDKSYTAVNSLLTDLGINVL